MSFLPEGLTLAGDFWCCPSSCSCFSSSSCTSSREHLNTRAKLRDCPTRLNRKAASEKYATEPVFTTGLYLKRQRQPYSSLLAGAVAGSIGSVAGRRDETGETNRQTNPITQLRATFYRCVLSPNALSLCTFIFPYVYYRKASNPLDKLGERITELIDLAYRLGCKVNISRGGAKRKHFFELFDLVN